MKQFLKLIILHVLLLSIFSCTGGAGGGGASSSSETAVAPLPVPVPAVPGSTTPTTPTTPNLPAASTLISVKLLQLDEEQFQCGGGFSSYLKHNKVSIKVLFDADRTFKAVVNFYDSPCSNLALAGNKIATYTVGGDYAVTTVSGTVIMTITSSIMTINAGEFPTSAKNMVDWINGCANLVGTFSSSQNTTLSLTPGPDCKNVKGQSFSFPIVGSTVESTEEGIRRFVGLNSDQNQHN